MIAAAAEVSSGKRQRDTAWIAYGLTIFVSAFLLFQVELIISDYLLPWFGGSAAVCFFKTARPSAVLGE